MKEEKQIVCYDAELGLEAFQFKGIDQPFPAHFHEYYVIGFMESGVRCLVCENREYTVRPGHILLFNPHDSHGCTGCGNHFLDYGALNIPCETMSCLAKKITGRKTLPHFSESVICHAVLSEHLHKLHQMLTSGESLCKKEELLLFIFSVLIGQYDDHAPDTPPNSRSKTDLLCAYIKAHLHEHLTLEALCRISGQSKSTLLRAFTAEKGISPYRYLQVLRTEQAKALLGKGFPPAQVAGCTGFSDQSHFSNVFRSFLGITPAAYQLAFRKNSLCSVEKEVAQ